MASIRERNNKFVVIYKYKDDDGQTHQKWETYDTKKEAQNRKKEIEYKIATHDFIIPQCKLLRELLDEYIELYGKEKWALSTYEGNVGLINNYIRPIIGETKLEDINTRYIEKYYYTLLETPAVGRNNRRKTKDKFVTSSTVRDVHKLLRSCFKQAVKWELMEKNPCEYANVPKYKAKKREIWTAETLMYALEVSDDEVLNMALNLSFAGSLRIGELLGLTWDCVDISEEAIENARCYIQINKEVQRVRKDSLEALDKKDVILLFPEEKKNGTTIRILKTPKTESSVRKIFIPKSVAQELIKWKARQDEIKEILGCDYQDYNIVMATTSGLPYSDSNIRDKMRQLIEDYDLPPVVFHSLRHTSVTYKLKLNGGDIKAVQGDSGHSQINMVTDVYSHIIDEDRRKNAELFENAFYKKENLNPSIHGGSEDQPIQGMIKVPEGVDAEALVKVLGNPEMAALLSSLAKTMKTK